MKVKVVDPMYKYFGGKLRCQSCNGNGGTHMPTIPSSLVWPWVECEECKGEGSFLPMVEVEDES